MEVGYGQETKPNQFNMNHTGSARHWGWRPGGCGVGRQRWACSLETRVSASCTPNSRTSGMSPDLSLFPLLQNGVNSIQSTVQCGERQALCTVPVITTATHHPTPALRTGWAVRPPLPPFSQRTWCNQLSSP